MNTANKITLSRIFIIPIFMFFLMTDYLPYSKYIALGLFIIASATDGIDGYIARKYNQVTNFGKFIDPLADKLLISSALICMVEFGWISSVAVLLIIAREFMVTSLRIVAISAGKVMAATFSGKLKMVVQIVAISILIVGHDLSYLPFAEAIASHVEVVMQCVIWLTVAVTLYSGVDYMAKNWKLIDFKS